MDFFFGYPLDRIPDWWKAQSQWHPEEDFRTPPVIAKDQKDIPEWSKVHHQWEPAVDVNKLTKRQLKVKMCCSKCAEKVVEEIREVYGVFDVRAEQYENKVIVVATPNGFDEHEVLMKARKIHRKAKFVELDAKEKPKKDEKKKQEDDKNKDDNEGNKKNKDKKELQTNPSQSKSNIGQMIWGQQIHYWPISMNEPRYFYPPTQIQSYPNPHCQFVRFL